MRLNLNNKEYNLKDSDFDTKTPSGTPVFWIMHWGTHNLKGPNTLKVASNPIVDVISKYCW